MKIDITSLKKWLPDVLAVVFFAVLAFAYFFPADIEGRVLNQGDISAGAAAGHEQGEYRMRTGKMTRWTNALFSGMPTYQMSPAYDSTTTLTVAEKAYHLWLPDNVWYLFVYLLGFYLLLRAFSFRQWLAAAGSIAWAFSTYFLIIIAAGHLWKVMALAYLPPLIAGIVLAYRGKYMWGLVVTALFTAFEIHANHLQMTYYFLMVMLFMVVAFLVDAVRQKRLAHFAKATAACMAGGLLGLTINMSNLYHTWQYSKETMRGKSELVKEHTADQTSSGLDRSYITTYSYGIGETWTLLVPNTKGGTSARALGENSAAKKEGDSHAFDLGAGQRVPYSYLFNQLPQYWEESMEPGATGTSGPVYVGAFVLMLFVFSLFIVKGPMKWALLAATVLSVMLSWGKNFMGLTDFFIDHVPMYAKFRAVESILVVAEFTIPLLAMLALKKTVDDPSVLKRHSKALYASFALTGGVALLFALAPTVFFSFTTQAEAQQFGQMLPQGQLQPFLESLSRARQAVFTADCWRSLLVVVVGTALLLLYRARRLKAVPTVALIGVLCLADLWQVNKRYLNDAMFMPRQERQQVRQATEADLQIMKDTTLDYRVMSLAPNVFNENETSYYHKSVGGYHAAKLRRYQDLIDRYISAEQLTARQAIIDSQGDLSTVRGDSLWPVLNMLNTKYFLMAQQNISVHNPYNLGNAWMVDRIDYVDNANSEIDALSRIDLRRVAVADRRFESVLGAAAAQDSTTSVRMDSYEPNRLNYTVHSANGGVLVFSEIFYPGWTATVDDQPAELGRVDYVLRAMHIDGGTHQVELTFMPTSIATTETLAYIALSLLLLIVIVAIVKQIKRKK